MRRALRKLLPVALLLALATCSDTPAEGGGAAGSGGGSGGGGGTGGAAAAQLVINEVVPAPADGGADWIELLVVGQGSVALGDYTLVDGGADRSPVALPAGELASGEFLVVEASAAPPAGAAPLLPFGLGRTDSVTLARAGVEVDAVAWTEAEVPAGAGTGRLPDGTGAFAATTPTRGAANRALEALPLAEPPFGEDHVAELRIELAPADWDAILADPLAEEWQPAALEYDGLRLEQISVRVKGNSSLQSVARLGSHRFSFKVDLDDTIPGQALHGQSKLILNNGFKDPTLIRETIAYAIAREAGLPAPRTAFVDLWVGGEHLGVYTLVEDVGGDFLDRNFADGDGILYKPEAPAGTLRYVGPDIASYGALEAERHPELGPDAFLALVATLDHGDPAEYGTVLDVEQALRYLAVNGLLASLDSYLGTAHNFYLYGPGGVFTVIPWDANEAFGTFACGCDRAGIVDLKIDEPTCAPAAERPLVTKLLAVPEHAARYHELVVALLDGPFAEAAMQARIERLAAQIRDRVAADPAKFFPTSDFELGLTDDVPGSDPARPAAIGLLAFTRERAAAVRAQLAGERPADAGGLGSCRGGGGPGPGGRCGDGICDQVEQGNPALCPGDCP